MSQKSSILKPRNSESSSTKKRVSWGNERVLEFVSQKGSQSQDSYFSESSEEDEADFRGMTYAISALSPSARALGPILEEVDNSSNSRALTPVTEEEENSIHNVSVSTKFDSQNSMNYLFPELELFEFKNVIWDFKNLKKPIKKTPKKDYNSEALLNEAKENLVRSKADLEILILQKEKYMRKSDQIKEIVRNFNLHAMDIRKSDKLKEEYERKRFNEIVAEVNYFNERSMMDISMENRWVQIRSYNESEHCKVFEHKGSLMDNSNLADLTVAFDKKSVSLTVKKKFKLESIESIWKKFKAYLEKISTGTESSILSNVSAKWCFFIKFTESYNKISMVSDIKSIETSESTAKITGNFVDLEWEVTLSFPDISQTWDIFTAVSNIVTNKLIN